jgi:hypothetical protein
MRRYRTDPDLQRFLLTAVRAWMHMPANELYIPSANDCPERLTDLITTQTAIGWRQLFNGRFSNQWAQRQNEYYARVETNQRNRRQTGHQWQPNIIGVIWERGF